MEASLVIFTLRANCFRTLCQRFSVFVPTFTPDMRIRIRILEPCLLSLGQTMQGGGWQEVGAKIA
jgi:hypothetical protein